MSAECDVAFRLNVGRFLEAEAEDEDPKYFESTDCFIVKGVWCLGLEYYARKQPQVA